MLKRKIKSLIGLDIGSRTIKAVELTREGHGFVMTGYGQTEVLSEDQRPDAILEVLRDNAFHTKRVVTSRVSFFCETESEILMSITRQINLNLI